MDIRKVAYEKFRLQWMLDHGYTLSDLIRQIQLCLDEQDEDESINLDVLFEEWEHSFGFNGSIWPCFDEFLESEYLSFDYMRSLLSGAEFEEYTKELDGDMDAVSF